MTRVTRQQSFHFFHVVFRTRRTLISISVHVSAILQARCSEATFTDRRQQNVLKTQSNSKTIIQQQYPPFGVYPCEQHKTTERSQTALIITIVWHTQTCRESISNKTWYVNHDAAKIFTDVAESKMVTSLTHNQSCKTQLHLKPHPHSPDGEGQLGVLVSNSG